MSEQRAGSLRDQTVAETLDAFASPSPTPGGGSASALAGALGAAVISMVAAMPRTRRGVSDDRESLDRALGELERTRRRLLSLVDEDAAAYDAVTAAYRMPKVADEEKATRRAAIQQALRLATETPLEVMRVCAAALQEAETVARHGAASAASDIGVGVELLHAALRGAALNVAINLDGLSDEGYVGGVRDEAARLSASGAVGADRARRGLDQ